MYLLSHFFQEILLFLLQWVQLVRNIMETMQESQNKKTKDIYRIFF